MDTQISRPVGYVNILGSNIKKEMIRGFENIIKWCKNPEEIENVRKEELDLWPIHEGHWFKFLKIDDKWRMIDLEIFGLIKALNDSGLTCRSCRRKF